MPHGRALKLCLLSAVLAAATARAESGQSYAEKHAGMHRWEDPDVLHDAARRESFEYTDMFEHRKEKPVWSMRVFVDHPEYKTHPEKLPTTLLLGDMLFHAPTLLGKPAAFFGLSCASCHPNGATTIDIDVGTVHDLPGNIDMTSQYFNLFADDGMIDPRNIPSLRGVRYTAPYGHAGSVGSVGEFVDHVVSAEMAQTPIRRDWQGAIAAYVEQFDFLPNPRLDELGRLKATASEPEHRGEKLFMAARPQFDGMSCATCHVPESFFTDRRSHQLRHGDGDDVATEGFDTPTLLNLSETPPYFYNGSAKTLPDAVRMIDARHKLGLTDDEKRDLTAYLDAVGAVDQPAAVPTLDEQVNHPLAYLSLLTTGPLADDAPLWTVCLETVRHQLHGIVRSAPAGQKAALEPAVKAFEQRVAVAENGTPSPANRAAIAELRERIAKALAQADKASPTAKHAAHK